MTLVGHDVELWSEFRKLSGWKSIRISADLTKACREFELEAIDINLPVADPPGNPVLMRPGDACQVYAGTDIALSGGIDRIRIVAKKDETGITIAGRSTTREAVDCTSIAARDRWRNAWFLDIASELCDPYGVEVVTEVARGVTDERVERFAVRRAEKVFQALERLANERGVMLTDDAQGRLVVTRAGAVRSETQLSLGENIEESDFNYDSSGLYDLIHCRGMMAPADGDSADVIAVLEEAEEDAVQAARTLEVLPQGRATRANCKRRAETEAMVRRGRAVDGTIKVSGWRQGNGELWRPNLVVQYTDIIQGILADLLIVSTDHTLSLDAGEVCTMRLGLIDGYRLPDPVSKAKRKRKPIANGVGAFAALTDLAVERTRPRAKTLRELGTRGLSAGIRGTRGGSGL